MTSRRSIWLEIACRPHVVLLLAACVVITSICALPSLKYEQDVLYLFRTAQTVQAETFADENTVVLLVGADDCLHPRIINEIREFVDQVGEIPTVQGVVSLDDARRPHRVGRLFLRVFPKEYDKSELPRIREHVSNHPLLHGHLISADHKWARTIIRIDSQIDTESLHAVVFKVKSIASQSFQSPDTKVYVSGLPAVQWEIKQSLLRDQRLFITGGIVAGFLLSFVIFRSWQSVLIVMAGPVVGAISTFGFMAVWGEAINPLNVVVIPMALTIALTDSVHLQMQIQRLRQSGLAKIDAIVQSMQEVGPACVLTSVTTIIGFGSLATARLLTIQRFGIVCGVSVALSLLAVLVLVPSLAMLLDTKLASRGASRAEQNMDRIFQRLGRFAVGKCRMIMVVGILAMALMLFVAASLKPRISMAEGLPIGSDTQQAVDVADSNFGGTLPLRISVSWNPDDRPSSQAISQATEAVVQLVESEKLFAKPLSFHDLVRSLPARRVSELKHVPREYSKQFISFSEGRSFVSTWLPDAGSDHLAPRLTSLNEQFDSLTKQHDGFQFSYNRRDFEPIHLGGTLIRDLAYSLLTAAVLCTLVVAIGFRSWRLGLIALLPNCLPLVATGCLMSIVGIPLQLTSVTVFAIALGVAVDDTIHVLRRHQLSKSDSQDARIVEALVHVGYPVCITTVILVVGLSVVLLSRIPAMHQFGFLFIASLFWALIGDLLLLPALLTKWGSRSDVQNTDPG